MCNVIKISIMILLLHYSNTATAYKIALGIQNTDYTFTDNISNIFKIYNQSLRFFKLTIVVNLNRY